MGPSWASSTLSPEYPIRLTDTPLYLPLCSPDLYPSDGPVTHTHASQWVHGSDELVSWIFRYLPVNIDA